MAEHLRRFACAASKVLLVTETKRPSEGCVTVAFGRAPEEAREPQAATLQAALLKQLNIFKHL